MNELSDCGCCEGINAETPVMVYNRPGLKVIRNRVGTHARFKESMLASLSASTRIALQNLSTREDDDFSIALLDSWAIVADILTFYQERIANESYLRTATERVSLLHLARLIGYELRPGVAASTYLAFTVDDPTLTAAMGTALSATPSTPIEATIAKGTKVQSIPGQDEQAQIFETIEEIKARTPWNDIKPRLTERQRLTKNTDSLFFEGTATNLNTGDGVLFKAVDGDGTAVFGLVAEVNPDPEQDYTRVALQLLPTSSVYGEMPDIDAEAPDLGSTANRYVGQTISTDDLHADAIADGFSVQDLFDNLAASLEPSLNVLVFRTRAAVFGHNAPAWETLPSMLRGDELIYTTKNGKVEISTVAGPYKYRKGSWADADLMNYLNYLDPQLNYSMINRNSTERADSGRVMMAMAPEVVQIDAAMHIQPPNYYYQITDQSERTDVYLDNVYSNIVQDGTVILKDRDTWGVFEVAGLTDLSVSDFTLSAKVTCLTLDSNDTFEKFGIRTTTVYTGSEVLALARLPINADFPPDILIIRFKLDDTESEVPVLSRLPIEMDFSTDPWTTRFKLDDTESEVPILSRLPLKVDLSTDPLTIRFKPDGWIDARIGGRIHLKHLSATLLKLDGWIDGLSAGQRIIISGEIADERGIPTVECATIDRVEHVLTRDGGTQITLKESLADKYLRSTVAINANVAAATHGETREEILGSGDATQSFQSFVLRQPPLTHVSAATPSGAESTLEVWVNEVLWHEVSTLYEHGPTERIYTTRTDDEAVTTVMFGDGTTGARLPTGLENVRATYRKGIGTEGLVKAGQLSLLMTRPLGVREVINLLDADGADYRESRDDARSNAPLNMLTLDRIVSLTDYGDFARAYSGIAKALATWTWDGERRSAFVTVAGPDGAEIGAGSSLYKNLLLSMNAAGDPSTPLQVTSYRQALFKLAATVKIDSDYQPDTVLDAVKKALRSHFSFGERAFGQPVTLSEVIAVIQAVTGVIAVNVTKLYRSGTTPDATPPGHLIAAMPEAGTDVTLAAELLTLDPCPLAELGAST